MILPFFTYFKRVQLLLCWLIPHIITAQEPYSMLIDKPGGLPSQMVYDICQDKAGIMWFATDKGLCSYDGSVFRLFALDSQNDPAGSCIIEDIKGRIWYSNFAGYLYFVEKGKLNLFKGQKEVLGYTKFGITDKYLYTFERSRLIVFDIVSLKRIKEIPFNGSFLRAAYTSNNRFYFLSDLSLHEISNDLVLQKHYFPADSESSKLYTIMSCTDKDLLFLSKYSSYYYHRQNGLYYKRCLPDCKGFLQNAFYIDSTLWVCTTKGVFTAGGENYFSDYNISSIYKDRNNHYWFAAFNKGILFVPDIDSKAFRLLSPPLSMTVAGNTIFYGTEDDCINSFNYGKDLQIKNIFKGVSGHETYRLWVDKGENRLFASSDRFQVHDLNGKLKGEHIVAVKDMCVVDKGQYAFAASGVLGFIEFSSKLSLKNADDKNLLVFKELLSGVQAKSVAYNRYNHKLYFATGSDIVTYDFKTITDLKYQNKAMLLKKLKACDKSVFGLTNDNRLLLIDSGNHISFPPVNERLNSPIVNFSVADHYLIIVAADKIYEYDTRSGKLRLLCTLLNKEEVTDIILQGDHYLLSHDKGIISVNRNSTSNDVPPVLYIRSIFVNNAEGSEVKIQNLDYTENSISINYSVISAIPEGQYNVFYKINDDRWTLLDRSNKVVLLNALGPGQYKVSLRAVAGKSFSKPVSLLININSPYWRQLWFMLTVAALLLLLVYRLYLWQLRRMENQKQLLIDKANLENDIARFRLQSIKSQMNPHFFYNALNTLQSYILSNDKRHAVDYLALFSQLTRKILEMSDKETVSIEEEVAFLSFYLEIEKERLDETFSYIIKVSENISPMQEHIPALLLQPYVENAIKHGLLHKDGKKQISIEFIKEGENCIITIDDNGIGRVASNSYNKSQRMKPASFATRAIENRVQLLNRKVPGYVSVQYIDKKNALEEAKGTTVIISIKINPKL